MTSLAPETEVPIRNELLAGRQRAAWIFLAPMLITLIVVAAYPLALSIWFSFTDASLVHLPDAQFVGIKNYYHCFKTDAGTTRCNGVLLDPAWWNAVWNTVKFGVVSVTLETILGLAIALVLNANFKGRGIVRAAILIPWAIPTVVSAKNKCFVGVKMPGPRSLTCRRPRLGRCVRPHCWSMCWPRSVDTSM